MDIGLILLIFVLLMFCGVGPWWGWHTLGWGPSGGFGLIFVILLILYLLGYFPRRQ